MNKTLKIILQEIRKEYGEALLHSDFYHSAESEGLKKAINIIEKYSNQGE